MHVYIWIYIPEFHRGFLPGVGKYLVYLKLFAHFYNGISLYKKKERQEMSNDPFEEILGFLNRCIDVKGPQNLGKFPEDSSVPQFPKEY